VRTGRGVALSEPGQEALTRVQSVLREIDQLSEDVRSAGQLPSGHVALALPPSLLRSLLLKLVNRLRSEQPDIRLRATWFSRPCSSRSSVAPHVKWRRWPPPCFAPIA